MGRAEKKKMNWRRTGRIKGSSLWNDRVFSRYNAGFYAITFALICGLLLLRIFAATPTPTLAKAVDVTDVQHCEQQAPILAAAGVKWVRVIAGTWSAGESAKGAISQSDVGKLNTYKTCFEAYKNQGIKVLALLYSTPAWARASSCQFGSRCAPTDPRDLAWFMWHAKDSQDKTSDGTGAVTFFGETVDAWEIYNEVNLKDQFFAGTDEQYAAMLKAVYPAIKQADQATSLNQTVVMGGAAMTGSNDDETWLRTMKNLGVADYIDAVGLHPYPGLYDAGGSCPTASQTDKFSRTATDYKIFNKPIWFTEFGFGSAPGSPGKCGDPATQAARLTDFLNYIKNHQADLHVQAAMWFLADDGKWGDAPNACLGQSPDIPWVWYSFKLLNISWSASCLPTYSGRPVYDALKAWPANPPAPTIDLSVSGSGKNLSVLADANSAYSNIKLVDFYANGSKLQTTETYPYTLDTTKLEPGAYRSVKAVATDYNGVTATSNTVVSINVPDSVAPAVSITSPVSSASVSGQVTVTASASDNVGVASVQFKLDGTNLGSEINKAPYSINWDTSKISGSHKLTAVAKDAAGNTATSAPISVNVSDNVAPTISLTAPASGATVSGNDVKVTANATDNVAVNSVQFSLIYPDGQIAELGQRLSSMPYQYDWDTTGLADGAYSLRATATDSTGNATISNIARVNVKNTVTPPPDTIAPSVPAGLQSVTVTASSITLSWNASTDNSGGSGVKDYIVYRNGKKLAATTTLNYVDSNLSKFTKYNYAVSAEDNAIKVNESAKTATLSVQTAAPLPDVGLSGQNGLRLRGTATVGADASSIAGVASVQFSLDYGTSGTVELDMADTTTPYSATFDTTKFKDGMHTITAIATDSTGQRSQPSTFQVVIDNTAPTVTITSPKNNAELKNTIRLDASASDNDAIAGVQFKLDGNNLGSEINLPPYSYVWDTTPIADGNHVITAVAYDQAGNSTATSQMPVTIKNRGTPTLDQNAPSTPTGLSGSKVTTHGVVLSWSASTDGNGSGIGGYAIYRNGQQIASTSQTSFIDNSLTPGTAYDYAVSAFDNAGNVSDKTAKISVTTESVELKSGDANGDGKINITDLSILLTDFAKPKLAGDFNHDGIVNIVDLSILLSNYGK